MKLALVGINHRTAPVQIRELLAFRPEDLPVALMSVQARGAKEALILSTCNRVELTASLDDLTRPETLFETFFDSHSELDRSLVRPHLYLYEGTHAIRHLFRVAASLDSMIVGEPQILGQLKQAFAQARDQGAIGAVLDSVMTRAFMVAKRIRTETEIGQNAVSVSYAAVELAREIFGSLNRKHVLVIGAGKMSESAARNLLRAGATHISVTNRTPERAEEMAVAFRGDVVPYESFSGRLAEFDIILASSASPEYVVTCDMVRRALDSRRNEPMFLIDIAVPRNIQPDIHDIEHAYLFDIDDLQRLAERNLQMRREVAEQAETIVDEEVARLEARLREREVAPTIAGLQEQLEGIRIGVLGRYRARLGTLNEDQQEALDALTKGIVNKIAHGPISELRRQASQNIEDSDPREGELLSNMVRRMFGLRDR